MTSFSSTPLVIVVPGFIQGKNAVELSSRSLLRTFSNAGFEVRLARLPGRGSPEGAKGFRFADYVGLLNDEIHEAGLVHQKVSIIGHSLGGLLSLCLPQETQQRLHRRIVLGSPLAPSITTSLAPLLDKILFPIANTFHQLDLPFPGRSFGKLFYFLRHGMNHSKIKFPLQVWSPGAFNDDEWPEVLYDGFISDSFGVLADLFHLNLSAGQWAGNLEASPRISYINAPNTLVIAGDVDAIAPVDQVYALFKKLNCSEKNFWIAGKQTCGVSFGHIDLLIGRHTPKWIWPKMLRFLQDS